MRNSFHTKLNARYRLDGGRLASCFIMLRNQLSGNCEACDFGVSYHSCFSTVVRRKRNRKNAAMAMPTG